MGKLNLQGADLMNIPVKVEQKEAGRHSVAESCSRRIGSKALNSDHLEPS